MKVNPEFPSSSWDASPGWPVGKQSKVYVLSSAIINNCGSLIVCRILQEFHSISKWPTVPAAEGEGVEQQPPNRDHPEESLSPTRTGKEEEEEEVPCLLPINTPPPSSHPQSLKWFSQPFTCRPLFHGCFS